MTEKKMEPVPDVLEAPKPGHRRRFSTEQKEQLLREAAEPGSSISLVARRFGISPSLLFRWKRAQDEGALAGLAAQERVVGESEVKDLKAKVRELERLLGKKTMEVEILKEAVDFQRGKGWLPRSTSPGKAGSR
jgi:transposase